MTLRLILRFDFLIGFVEYSSAFTKNLHQIKESEGIKRNANRVSHKTS